MNTTQLKVCESKSLVVLSLLRAERKLVKLNCNYEGTANDTQKIQQQGWTWKGISLQRTCGARSVMNDPGDWKQSTENLSFVKTAQIPQHVSSRTEIIVGRSNLFYAQNNYDQKLGGTAHPSAEVVRFMLIDLSSMLPGHSELIS